MTIDRDPEVAREARLILKVLRRCAYCNRTGGMYLDPDGEIWHMDHVIPLYLNGSDSLDNITKACKACNMTKGIRLWDKRRVITAGKFQNRFGASPKLKAQTAEFKRRQRAVSRANDPDRREQLQAIYHKREAV